MQPLTLTTAELTGWVGQFFWPFTRVMAMLAITPVIGGKNIPVPVKILLGLLLTIAVLPVNQATPSVTPWSAAGVYVVAQQILIGLSMGFILLLVFTAVNLAGHSIAMAMGLGFSLTVDPNQGVHVPIVSQFLSILASLLFLSLNGHLALISTLASSFELLPVASPGITSQGLWDIILWAAIMFSGALSIALPAIVAILISNLVMGVMTRSSPQLNIFSIGFPMTMLVGFVALLLTLPNMLPVFQRLMDLSFTRMMALTP